MIYKVKVYADYFTAFSGTKSFWFYKSALAFALRKIDYFSRVELYKFKKKINADLQRY